MGANGDRAPVTLRQRLIGLVVGVVSAAIAGIVLGESWAEGLGIAVGVLAVTLLIALSYARAPEASSRQALSGWLAAHYAAEAIFFSLFWAIAIAFLDGEFDRVDPLTGLPFGLLGAAFNTWSLWSECTGASSRVRLPSFGIAGRRQGRLHERDPNPRRPPEP